MTKTFCDRCEKEIPRKQKGAYFTIPGNQPVVLCLDNCFPALREFLGHYSDFPKPTPKIPEENRVSGTTSKAREE